MRMLSVSNDGQISHSPMELTTWEDCTRGADRLLSAAEGGRGRMQISQNPPAASQTATGQSSRCPKNQPNGSLAATRAPIITSDAKLQFELF